MYKKVLAILGAVLTLFALTGMIWATWVVFTPREIHNTAQAQDKAGRDLLVQQMTQQYNDMQKRWIVQDARATRIYWLKIVSFYKVQCAKRPGNQALRVELNKALTELAKAEKLLRQLEGR